MTIHYPNLNLIAQKRTGGAVNITGITYQFKYSCFKILQVNNDDTLITLEGIEDLDIIEKSNDKSFFTQLKYSKNVLTASGLNKMNTFTNFLEVYLVELNARFKVVTNEQFTDKNLCAIQNQNVKNSELGFWEEYFKKLRTNDPKTSKWNWDNFNLKDFLGKIEFEVISEIQLDAQCKNLIIDNHNILSDNQRLFISNIFYNIHTWSIIKKTITFQEIKDSIQETREDIAKGTENDAIKYRWIEPINFVNSSNADNSDYYQGKPAKPIHITLELPARRKRIEDEIEKSILENNITVLKASSGQGKSTLAWQVAYNLHQKGWTILELKVSEDLSKMSHLVDYLKFKIRTECTLLILDGLSRITEKWDELARNLSELPIKILITTREEDWSKYGSEIYKLSLSMPEIKLTFSEAGDIYKQFDKKGVIHINSDKSKNPFQYYWEQVEKKGLLIEYVYLITQGQMLESRLREQVKNIEKEENGGTAKLETLRLVALADVCNIKIETLQLNQFLRSENLLQNIDKRTLYVQLEREYSIRFEDDYIEGLHPVRSSHLLNILSEGTPIIETLANLCQIIDSEDFFYLFSFFPSLIVSQNKEKHFDYLIPRIHDNPYKSLSKAIDGLFAWEANNYWAENQETFNEIYLKGGNAAGYAFTMALIPYPNPENLNNLTEFFDGLIPILAKAGKMPKFDLFESSLNKFVTKLHGQFFKTMLSIRTLEGLSGLLRWFDIFYLPFSNGMQLSNNELLTLFDKYDIESVASFLKLYNVVRPNEYKFFLENHEQSILSILKEKTITPTLFIKDSQVFAEYLFNSSCSKEVNDLTNDRMSVFMKVLPYYTRYTVEGQFLHYPSESITRAIKSNSIESFTHETLIIEDYQARLNGMWHNEIDGKYQTSSEYEWQRYIINLREQCLLCVKMKVRLFEALLDDFPERYKKLINEIDIIGRKISELSHSNKKRPSIKNSSSKIEKKDNIEKNIREWEFSFITCFIKQFHTLLDLDKEKRRLARVNLQSAVSRLPKMQIAFEKITQKTYSYFDSRDLVKEEIEWYERLERSVLFYEEILQGNCKRHLQTAKDDCENWSKTVKKNKFDKIHKLLEEIEDEIGMLFKYPTFIQKEEYLEKLTIGVEMFDLQNIEGELIRILYGLTKLIHTDIHGFNIVVIDIYDHATNAFYLSKTYIEKLLSFTQTQVFEEDAHGLDMSPVPIVIDNELIAPLEGVTIGNQENLSAECGLIIEGSWLFTEYRNRLNMGSTIEKKWFEEIQRNYLTDMKNYIHKIHNSGFSQSIKDQIQNLYTEVIEGKNYTSTQFGEFLTKISLQNIVENDPMKEYKSFKN
jgi:hypothetical protein